MSKWVVITGASSGIGAAFAPRLAAKGYNLVLVARREEKLKETRDRVLAQHKVEIKVLKADLIEANAAQKVLDFTGPDIDILINNAGFGKAGQAVDGEAAAQLKMIDLNIRSLTELSLVYAPFMVKRGRGTILNVGSIVGFLPVPYFAVYAASKAYVLSFTEALDHELRPKGVRVKVLCPGSTDSEFYSVAQGSRPLTRPRLSMTAEDVAGVGVDMIDRGSTTRVAGLLNRCVALAPRFLPRRLMTTISGRFTPAAASA
jgi:uncharacterized protein